MKPITEILHYKNHAYWNTSINGTLSRYLKTQFPQTHWYNTRSYTFNKLLNDTIGRYNANGNPYDFLAGLCSLVLDHKPISIKADYITVNSTEAETLTLQTLKQMVQPFGTPSNTEINIYIHYCPKGKTYIKDCLDASENLQRLKAIENIYIANPYHFIRVYRHFEGTNVKDITIFTSDIYEGLPALIYVMLPNLLDITPNPNPIAADAPAEFVKEYELYNTRVKLIRTLFAELYNCKEFNSTESIRAFQVFLHDITNKIAETYDFTDSSLKSFAEQLANTVNSNALKHYTIELNSINNNITDLEQRLANLYVQQTDYQRRIIANKTLTPEDTTPFFETIKNTKAIEVLSGSQKTLQLRVTAPLQYFSEDFECYENNPKSDYNYLYADKPTLKTILHKIFKTKEYRLIVQAIITLEINANYNAQPLYARAQQYELKEFTQFPNPHLWHHNCWSQAKNELNKHICAGNFDLAVMQIVAAVQTVNVAENTSFVNGLLKDFLRKEIQNITHIIDHNGTVVTLADLIKIEENQTKEDINTALKTAQTNKTGYVQIELPDTDPEDDEDEILPNF